MDFFYDEVGQVFGFKYNSTEYWYIRNAQGDIIGIINNAGTQVVTYTYDAWGNPISTTGSLASTVGASNPYRYRGYYFDTETGFYYCNSRYYDPSIGRWINADGLIDNRGVITQNLFTYCVNNPVNLMDPTGTLSEDVQKGSGAPTKASDSSSSSFPLANHVNKTHQTITSVPLLNAGLLFGKIEYSITQNYQDDEFGFFNSYIDTSKDSAAVGVSIVDWLGVGLGLNGKEYNVFAQAQVTPWVHVEVSVGLDGIGLVLGWDDTKNNISHDFGITAGWLSVALLTVPFLKAFPMKKFVPAVKIAQ